LDADVTPLQEQGHSIKVQLDELGQLLNSPAECKNVREKNLNSGKIRVTVIPDQLRSDSQQCNIYRNFRKNVTYLDLSGLKHQPHDLQEQFATVTRYEHQLAQLRQFCVSQYSIIRETVA
jgi:hypothetical protein